MGLILPSSNQNILELIEQHFAPQSSIKSCYLILNIMKSKRLISKLCTTAAILTITLLPFSIVKSRDGDSLTLMWQVHPYSDIEELAELSAMGVTLVQSFSFFQSTQFQIDSFLSVAQKEGIGVIPFVGVFIEHSNDLCKLSEVGKDTLKKLSLNDTIYAWHTFDEPFFDKNATASCQLQIYEELKNLTPNIPVMISYNNSNRIHYLRNFTADAVDIVDLHKYSNPYPGKKQGELLNIAKSKFDFSQKTLIVTLRAFNSFGNSHEPVTDDSMLAEYKYLFGENSLTNNMGFYGWHLSPNIGIKKLPHVRRQFEAIMKERMR